MQLTKNYRDAVLIAISTLTILAAASIAPSLPYIATNLVHTQNPNFWAQTALGLPGIVVALTAVWISKKTRMHNIRFAMLCALILYGLAGVAYLIAPTSLFLLLASRSVLGFCVAVIMIFTTVELVKNKTPLEQKKSLGLQAAAGGFGGVLYIGLANQLTLWHGLAPFALYSFAWLLGLLFWFADKPSSKAITVDNSRRSLGSRLSLTARQGSETALNQSSALNLFWIFFAGLAAMEMLLLYSLIIQIPLLNIAPAYYLGLGLVITLLSVATTAALYSFFQMYISIEGQHILGFGLITIGFTLLGFLNSHLNLPQLYFILLLIGVGLGLLRPNLLAWLFSLIPNNQRQAAMGHLTTVFFASQFAAPIVVYPVVEAFGISALWTLLATSALIWLFVIAWFAQFVKSSSVATFTPPS